jgi:hypothetical protein
VYARRRKDAAGQFILCGHLTDLIQIIAVTRRKAEEFNFNSVWLRKTNVREEEAAQ